MFERFTDRARRVVVLAQEESRLLGHNYIGTEHLLLGLVHEGEGVGAKALEAMGIELGAVRFWVEEIIGRGGQELSGHIPFTPRAKKVLELSLREGMQLGHNHIGTEHILLGLVREGEGVAAQILVKAGVELSRVRTTVVALLAGATPEAAPSVRWISPPTTLGIRPGRECAFCGRERWELRRQVVGRHVLICADCIERANEALTTTAESEITLPPLAEGEPPDATAVDRIVSAFRAVFGPMVEGEREQALEDGAAVAHLADEVGQRYTGAAETLVVQRVRFRAAEDADVTFSVLGSSFAGRALHLDGRWKVSRETWCHMLARGGIQCPPREP